MIIRDFELDTNYISNDGETRPYKVVANNGSIFSLVVEKLTGSTTTYYNFSTQTFGSSFKRLKNRKITNSYYEGEIVFPAGGLSSGNNPNTYTFKLFAESAYGTTHMSGVEARFADGSLDLNGSTGSNSNLLQKIIYQYPITVVTIAGSTPNNVTAFTGPQANTANSVSVQRGRGTGSNPFSLTFTLNAARTGLLKRQPIPSDFFAFSGVTFTEPMATPKNEISTAESGTTNNPRATSNRVVFNEGSDMPSVGWTLVSNNFVNPTGTPIIVTHINPDGDNALEVQINQSLYYGSAASTATLSISMQNIYYYRWKASDVSRLTSGLTLIVASVVASTDAVIISEFKDFTTQVIETTDSDGGVTEEEVEIINSYFPPIDTSGYSPTVTRGVITSQAGLVTLNTAQNPSTFRNVAAKFFAYGPRGIDLIHDTSLNITNLKAELTPVTTTVNDASNADGATAQTAIVVASATGIRDDVSIMSGVNVTATSVNPLVTNISGTTLTVSPAQFLQHGETLTFTGAGQTFTITGNLEFKNVDAVDFTLAVDLEKFITAS